MSLQYDTEFLKEAGPILQQAAHAAKTELTGVPAIRSRIAATSNPSPLLETPEHPEKLVYTIPTPDGHGIAIHHVRIRQEKRENKQSAVLHVHGGGYIAMSAEDFSALVVGAVSRTGVQFLSVDYRIAPEHPYPTPLDDCWAALQWVHANAEELFIDPTRIAVMGESAGGGLAAALAIRGRDQALSPPIAKQILIYPMIDNQTKDDHTGGLLLWSREDNITGWAGYLGPDIESDKVDALAAPARVDSVVGLPPLYLDCGQLDLFLSEGLEYARRFLMANITTELHIYPGLPHGFEGLSSKAPLVQQATVNRDRAILSF